MPSLWLADRAFWLQGSIAVAGTIAYCMLFRSFRDWWHVVYDVPACLFVFSFIGQLVTETWKDGWTAYGGSRLAMVAAMTVVCWGRHFWGWHISGHLSCVLAVALVQTFVPRLDWPERLIYWAPVPMVLYIRWAAFDLGVHAQSYFAILFAVIVSLTPITVSRFLVVRS